MEIIDIHTHCFPDFLAEKAMSALADDPDKPSYESHHKGTLNSLLESMDKALITKSVVLSIATKPDQVENILEYSAKIKNERIEPFISVHPDYHNYDEILKKAKDKNIKGVKVHPHFQDFMIDDEKIFPLYESFCKHNIIVFFHSGGDLKFPGYDNATISRVVKVIDKFPQMRIVLAHWGGFKEWEEVYDKLAGRQVFLETSFVLEVGGYEIFKKILDKHSKDKVLFGTDSPWTDQKNAVELVKQAPISAEQKQKIFFENYYKLIS